MHQLVLIIDFGGHQAQNIARQVRGLGCYCEVLSYTAQDSRAGKNPSGVILAGGENDCAAQYLPDCDAPVLNAVGNDCVPEESLRVFIEDECKITPDWNMQSYAEAQIASIREKTAGGLILLGLSGGVDSSVVAALLSKAVGSRLHCIFVDHGLMRKNEGDEVVAAFKDRDISLIRVDAGERFLARLKGVTDPEAKRKIIGEEFIRVFEEESKKLGRVDYLAQGTIYSDVIESGIGGKFVKSHHNVGGLPEHVDFKELIEPLRMLFKDEVRELGRTLGLPDYIVNRQPFPGPGLGIRVIGEVTKERLDTLRDADYIFRDEITKVGLDRSLGQYFAVLTDMRSVGVTGGVRSYDRTVALRAIITKDVMTAEWAKIPYEVLAKASSRILGEVGGVNRVVYDITDKPPGTIEWE